MSAGCFFAASKPGIACDVVYREQQPEEHPDKLDGEEFLVGDRS